MSKFSGVGRYGEIFLKTIEKCLKTKGFKNVYRFVNKHHFNHLNLSLKRPVPTYLIGILITVHTFGLLFTYIKWLQRAMSKYTQFPVNFETTTFKQMID